MTCRGALRIWPVLLLVAGCGSDAASGDSPDSGARREPDARRSDVDGAAPGDAGRDAAESRLDASPELEAAAPVAPDASDRGTADAEVSDAADAAPADAGQPETSAREAGPVVCGGPGARFVTGVVDHFFGPGQNLGQLTFPEPILGPPLGGGCCQGSLDTVSVGNGGWIIVEFEGNAIVDGPGADFIVFENAFYPGGDDSMPFAELATVEVSNDGRTWT